MSAMTGGAWLVVLALALLWPAHTLSAVDGIPLNGTVEAVVLGVLIPSLCVLNRRFLDYRAVRCAVVLLLAVKVADSLFLTQEGLCARFATAAPYSTRVLTIPVEEPRGFLRSWDVRADWRSDTPRCTAVFDRAYPTWSAFPAWFVNLTDFVPGSEQNVHPGRSLPRHFTLEIEGVLSADGPGRFGVEVGDDMTVGGSVASIDVPELRGSSIAVTLGPGDHPIALRAAMTGDRWKFIPSWNGRSAFDAAMFTVGPRRAVERWLTPVVRYATVGLIAALVFAWSLSTMASWRDSPAAIAWSLCATAGVIAMAGHDRLERLAVPLLLFAPYVSISAAHRTWRGALFLLGLPWFAFFTAHSLAQVGHLSLYSVDDWLAYQVAGYRIYMNGFWLQGGTPGFDYQPLYRWITGALHLVFGDSSVGETYLDAASLLAGGLAAFVIARSVVGFRWALAGAAMTLTTFALSPIWYFFGRGLSEIVAAGFAFSAALCLSSVEPPDDVGWVRAAGAALLALFAFYTRLNHLVFGISLVALLIPPRVTTVWRDFRFLQRRTDYRPLAAYLAVFASGVALFALRTWRYTGVFSVFYGTSFKYNDTGLRLSTIGSSDVWQRIAHSLNALVWMNEPPHPDPRSLLVATGVIAAVGAVCQLPRLRRLPARLTIVLLAAISGAFVAHTHAYPGRMSIHLVPFATAATMLAVAYAAGFVGPRARAEAALLQQTTPA